MKSVWKMTWRSVKTFFGRYMALLLIVAIGVGFFAGLKVTKDAMSKTYDRYLAEQNFYDFRLFSTLGFTEEDVEAFASAPGVGSAEGTYTLDVLMTYEGDDRPYQLLALPERVNLPSLVAGRMPEADNECLADDEIFGQSDIGRVIVVSDDNDPSTVSQLGGKEYTIVGLVDSPMYIGLDRGQTGIGNGSLYGFLYLPAANFTGGVYTEVNLTLTGQADAYSEEYDTLIAEHKDDIAALCRQLAGERYDRLVGEVLAGLGLPADMELTDQMKEMLAEAGLAEQTTYVLTRAENAGYVSFESDTSIISGIANIFPVFFILIAMLVCMTTMSRMVDEERTRIGTLKALGYSNAAIVAKYLLYAGSATVIGWAVGFMVCTWGFPQIFWYAYNAIYDFASLAYLFSPSLALITLAVSLAGILGAAFFSCRKELMAVPAALIRPKATKSGKRILLERFRPLWRRLSFLQKIITRNMVRYKRRLVMMLVGIGCCAGLVVTAFGVRDSMVGIGSFQYETVQTYDMEAVFAEGSEQAVREQLEGIDEIERILTASVHRVDLHAEETMNSVSLMSVRDTGSLTEFWDFHRGNQTVAYPGKGEAIINNKIAETLGLAVGDTFTVRDADMRSCTVTVSGIFDNYILNYVVISEDTYAEAFGEWEANTAMLAVDGDADTVAEQLTALPEVTSVSVLADTAKAVDDALSCLNYIIWIVILFSAALAFIVIFNLTNINLAERSREIATVEVLGFYPKETNSYVLRENLILAVVASILGLPLGTLFHRIVMSMVVIDSFAFNIHVTPLSYVLSFVCTVLFAVIVNLFMRRQIRNIKMAESLKAVE